MSQSSDFAPNGAKFPPRWEFIAICAGLMALNALAIDIMLPGMEMIGDSLGVVHENDRQSIVLYYFYGMAAALLIYGPLSDRFGRRKPLFVGLAIYLVAAFAAAFATTFETLLALRFIQGVGAASTRVIAVSIVRDRFGGRAMAEVMSLIFMVFMVIPIVAPSVGTLILLAFGDWREIFTVMAVGGFGFTLWAWLRMPETQHPEDKRPFEIGSIWTGFVVVLTNRTSLFYTLASTILFAALFGFIACAQQIYVDVYDLGVWFPVAFAAIAGMMAVSSFLNARLVGKLGMRRLSHGALLGFLTVSTIWLVWSLTQPLPFAAFLVLFGLAMFQFGWIGSNFNSISMEPLGHLAGTAASVQGFIQTLGGAYLGGLIGQAFDGTTTPLAIGFTAVAVVGLALVLIGEGGKLFQAPSENAPAASFNVH